MESISVKSAKVKQNSANCTNRKLTARRRKPSEQPISKQKKTRGRKPVQLAPKRYWLDVGKQISLALMAEKYEDAGGAE